MGVRWGKSPGALAIGLLSVLDGTPPPTAVYEQLRMGCGPSGPGGTRALWAIPSGPQGTPQPELFARCRPGRPKDWPLCDNIKAIKEPSKGQAGGGCQAERAALFCSSDKKQRKKQSVCMLVCARVPSKRQSERHGAVGQVEGATTSRLKRGGTSGEYR